MNALKNTEIDASPSTVVCEYCGEEYINGEYEKSASGEGFWCDTCDMFNYYPSISSDRQHKFKLSLEAPSRSEGKRTTAIKFNKQLSPLRYPGGKSKIIETVYENINCAKTELFVEPYAGGGSVGLALLDAGVIEKLILNDIDYGIYCLFNTIITQPDKLIGLINEAYPTHRAFFEAKNRLANARNNGDELLVAFDTLLVNRLAYSGIAKANPLGGKHGSIEALTSRWNPHTLERRILQISKYREQIEVTNADALAVIEEHYWNCRATMFIDPPYILKGHQLYTQFYIKDDHIALATLLESLYGTCPGADIQLYYDDNELIYRIFSLPEIIRLNRKYSI